MLFLQRQKKRKYHPRKLSRAKAQFQINRKFENFENKKIEYLKT